MTTTAGGSDLGWSLGAVMRAYLRRAAAAVADVPGGSRGHQVLVTAGDGVAPTQLALAQHLGVDRTVMTYLIDDLERAGLVERRPDPADRRARQILLTAAGRVRLGELECSLRRAEEELMAPLAPDERQVLRDLLGRLAAGNAPANPCQVAAELA